MESRLKAEVTKIIIESPDVKTFRFSLLNTEKLDFVPGQFVFLYLNKNNEEIKRAYSIASGPLNKEFDLTLKLTATGQLTPYFHKHVKLGDVFEISEPMGKFTYEDQSNIVLIAGGSGIAPLMSMMRYCHDKNMDTSITLIYSSKDPDYIIYKNELKQLEDRPNFNIVHTMTRANGQWIGNKGRITRELIINNVQNKMDSIFYLCGPMEMIRTLAKDLKNEGIPREHIKREVWG